MEAGHFETDGRKATPRIAEIEALVAQLTSERDEARKEADETRRMFEAWFDLAEKTWF